LAPILERSKASAYTAAIAITQPIKNLPALCGRHLGLYQKYSGVLESFNSRRTIKKCNELHITWFFALYLITHYNYIFNYFARKKDKCIA
jgi:hypothetical protein